MVSPTGKQPQDFINRRLESLRGVRLPRPSTSARKHTYKVLDSNLPIATLPIYLSYKVETKVYGFFSDRTRVNKSSKKEPMGETVGEERTQKLNRVYRHMKRQAPGRLTSRGHLQVARTFANRAGLFAGGVLGLLLTLRKEFKESQELEIIKQSSEKAERNIGKLQEDFKTNQETADETLRKQAALNERFIEELTHGVAKVDEIADKVDQLEESLKEKGGFSLNPLNWIRSP